LAEQIKFTDWVGVAETDPDTNQEIKKIGTQAKDGISSIWLSGSGEGTIQLTLTSKKSIASEYFSYRIDNVDNLMISSASRTCESNCLTEYVSKNGEVIKTMKRGLKMKLEYDTLPDTTHRPTFSLRGFSKAYKWLMAE